MILWVRNLDRAQLGGSSASGASAHVSHSAGIGWNPRGPLKYLVSQLVPMVFLSPGAVSSFTSLPTLFYSLVAGFPKNVPRGQTPQGEASACQIYTCFTLLMAYCPKQVTGPSPCLERTIQGHEHENVWFLGGLQDNSPPAYERIPVLTLVQDLTVQPAFPNVLEYTQPPNIISVMSKPQYELLTSSERASVS